MQWHSPEESKRMKIAKTKIDRPFLSKFNNNSVYFNSQDEFYKSIVKEIYYILESNLKLSDEYLKLNTCNLPFSYGTRDLQSIETSTEGLINFKIHCKESILKSEPRLSDIEITDISIDKEKQALTLKILCCLKNNNNETFETEVKLTN